MLAIFKVNQATHIKNIIFDYGGVIIDIDYGRTQKAFEELGISNFKEHFSQLQQSALFDDFEKGFISENEFRERLNKQAGTSFTNEQIDGAWNAMLLGVREDKIKLLTELYADYHTYLLSNTNLIHLKYITKYLIRAYGRANLDALFDKVYYSFVVGQRKPDPAIFQRVLNENTLKASETLYIDDSPQHVTAARSLGINAELFNSEEDLRSFIYRHVQATTNSAGQNT